MRCTARSTPLLEQVFATGEACVPFYPSVPDTRSPQQLVPLSRCKTTAQSCFDAPRLQELVPIKVAKEAKQKDVCAAPALTVTCESDIFAALGLAYVPPHMRFFNNMTKE